MEQAINENVFEQKAQTILAYLIKPLALRRWFSPEAVFLGVYGLALGGQDYDHYRT